MAGHFAERTRPYFTLAAGPQTPLVASIGLGCLVVAAVSDPRAVATGPVLCPFRLATGLPCPGCGLTRSWVYLAHGRWSEALGANPFGLVSMAAVVVLIVVVATCVFRGRPLPSMATLVSSRLFSAVTTVWVLFAIVRMAVVLAS
jgi:hypothetical protein